MKSFLRILTVWLVLLALPFAGAASAAAACCPPGAAQPMQPMQQAHTGMHHHEGCAGHHGKQVHGSKHDGKCANCAACCTAAMLAPLAITPPPLMPPAARHAFVFDAGHMPTVDLDHPERPPRFARA